MEITAIKKKIKNGLMYPGGGEKGKFSMVQ